MSTQIKFNEETLALVNKMIKRYPEGKHKSALLPILHIAQAEFGGWLSPETMDYVASILNIKPIEVYEVASFYSMYAAMRSIVSRKFNVRKSGYID